MTRRTKPSGITRLPEVPEDWSRSKLGFEARVKARLGWKGLKAEEYVDDGYVLLSTPNIKGREIDFENVNFISAERYLESPEIMLRAGDVLLTKDGFTLGTTNVVRHLPRAATLNGSIALIRPKESLFSVYLYYLLASDFFQYLVHLMKDGMDILHLFQADLRHFDVLLPPRAEQERIAAFLDEKTVAIDALIAKKERLIELLQEKRHALIARSVTRGLDASVLMRETTLTWSPRVPAAWTVWKLAHAFELIGSGTTPESQNPRYYDGDIPWVTTAELREQPIHNTTKHVTQRALDECSALTVYPVGTLLIAMYGATIGRLGLLEVPATTNQACCAFARSKHIHTRFLFYWFLAFREQVVGLGVGGGQPNISQDKLKSLHVPAPTLAEQEAIVRYLDTLLDRMSALEEKTRRSVERLREYRQALITAAVTGKIDVSREAAA